MILRAGGASPSVRGSVRKGLGTAVKASLGALGFQLARLPELDSNRATLEQRRLKFVKDQNVNLVLDVGANCGQFGARLRHDGYDGRIISFEPLAGPFAELERRIQGDDLWTARRLALGENDGQSVINVAANTWSSSVLPIAKRHVSAAPESAYVAEQAIAVARLDSVSRNFVGPADVVYLKADVQGYEGEVLGGAQKSLSRVVLIELELSLCTLYEGQAPYYELMERLDGLGYDPVAFENEFVEPGTGRVLQINVLFERRDIS
jgi:FkbM family methyltransferase